MSAGMALQALLGLPLVCATAFALLVALFGGNGRRSRRGGFRLVQRSEIVFGLGILPLKNGAQIAVFVNAVKVVIGYAVFFVGGIYCAGFGLGCLLLRRTRC